MATKDKRRARIDLNLSPKEDLTSDVMLQEYSAIEDEESSEGVGHVPYRRVAIS